MLDPRSSLLAPLGCVTAVFVHVGGAKALRGWSEALMAASCAVLHGAVEASAGEAGGYVVAQVGAGEGAGGWKSGQEAVEPGGAFVLARAEHPQWRFTPVAVVPVHVPLAA